MSVCEIHLIHEKSDDWFRVELDSHADTCCVGRDAMIVNETRKHVKVTPFLKSLGSVRKVPIVSAAMAYDDPRSGTTYVIIIHQALHFQELDHCLLCPMQLRLNDVVINERPKFLTAFPTDKDHAVICDQVIISLELNGITSYFPARKPTTEEFDICARIELTYPEPEWDPHLNEYSEEETRLMKNDETITRRDREIFSFSSYDGDKFVKDFKRMCLKQNEKEYNISFLTTNKTFKMTAEDLSRTWDIGILAAKSVVAALLMEPASADTMQWRIGRVEERRGGLGLRLGAITPFPLPAHRTGRADFRHPALRPASLQAHGGHFGRHRCSRRTTPSSPYTR